MQGGESFLAFPQVFYGRHFGKYMMIRTVVCNISDLQLI